MPREELAGGIQLSSSFDVGGQLRDVKVKVWGFFDFFFGKKSDASAVARIFRGFSNGNGKGDGDKNWDRAAQHVA